MFMEKLWKAANTHDENTQRYDTHKDCGEDRHNNCANRKPQISSKPIPHRSHSPNTTSIALNTAVVSASMWPFIMKSIACKWLNAVGLILHRYGLFEIGRAHV